DGLLHISEMSWGRVESPRKVFKVGQPLRVLIKDIQGNKIALSLKFPDEDPWAGASEKFAVGNIVTGRVARMADFGAFVELEPGIDALLHVSQIAKEHIDKPSDVLKIGQEVTAKIVDFNEENNKISLSIKALILDQERAERREAREAAREEESGDVASFDIEAAVAKAKAEAAAEEAAKAAEEAAAKAAEEAAEAAPAEEAPAEE
ncbi:MAG: S1 RNA-binding domain-containing protein, partial [Lachnospiraceae bacterium]|nr:S1 RNA-binding domain-containing protein [Lachnospiraceae bacterium]